MAGGRRWWALLIAVILIIGVIGLTVLGLIGTPSAPSRTPASLPCPNIIRSSPQTLSTDLPVHTESPCPGVFLGTYFGASRLDWVADVAIDTDGNTYAAGWTDSSDFPTTTNAFDRTMDGAGDAWWAKFSAEGTLLYSTYLGGIQLDFAFAITVDPSGNVYVTGETDSLVVTGDTTSSDFPTTPNAFDTTLSGGDDAFVAKFDGVGSLVYSTFLGGGCDNCTSFSRGRDVGTSIAVDPSGNAYVTGATMALDFPATAGFVGRPNPHRDESVWDVFVAKLNSDGTDLLYSIVVGGTDGNFGTDSPAEIAVDSSGDILVAGSTGSYDFPVTAGSFDTSFGEDGRDGFVLKLDPDARGTESLVYSTFLGGGTTIELPPGERVGESILAMSVDTAGNAYLSGVTDATDFPTSPGAYDSTLDGFSDGFFAVLDSSGMVLTYSTLIGGSSHDSISGIRLDQSGLVYLAGSTSSSDFPTSPGSFDATFNGIVDAFVAKFDPADGGIVYFTYLGGGDEVLFPNGPNDAPSGDVASSLEIVPSGNATVVGVTNSTDFPTTDGGFDPTYNGETDAFILQIELVPEPNRVPVAYLEITPPGENDSRVFVNASHSADAEDQDDVLEVQWDWEDDGRWDTDWSTSKTAWHEYPAAGTYTIRLQVRDTGGLTGTTTGTATVTAPASGPMEGRITPLALYALVAAFATGAVAVLLLWRRSRKGVR